MAKFKLIEIDKPETPITNEQFLGRQKLYKTKYKDIYITNRNHSESNENLEEKGMMAIVSMGEIKGQMKIAKVVLGYDKTFVESLIDVFYKNLEVKKIEVSRELELFDEIM